MNGASAGSSPPVVPAEGSPVSSEGSPGLVGPPLEDVLLPVGDGSSSGAKHAASKLVATIRGQVRALRTTRLSVSVWARSKRVSEAQRGSRVFTRVRMLSRRTMTHPPAGGWEALGMSDGG